MFGLLRFIIFFGTLVSLLVLVGVPALASPLLTSMVRDAGLRADEMRVSLAYFDPSLFAARSRRMTIEAREARLGPATVGAIDIALGNVALFERKFETLSGNLRDVALRTGGLEVSVARVEIEGPAAAAVVSAHLTPEQAAAVLRQAAALIGVQLGSFRLLDDAVRVELGGLTVQARLAVEGGALVLRPASGPALLLLQPAPSDPWRLTEAHVTPDGVELRGIVDVDAIVRRVGQR